MHRLRAVVFCFHAFRAGRGLIASQHHLLYTHAGTIHKRQVCMHPEDTIAVGIDSTSGHKAFTLAAIDRALRVIRLAEAEFDEVISFLEVQPRAIVALNTPSHVSAGIVRKRLERGRDAGRAVRGAELRESEFDLHSRGVAVSGTPRTEAQCPAWMQLGFALYRELPRMGYKAYPGGDASCQWLETHPHAAFCVLLGRSPLAKATLEGKLQRALVLFERGLGIHDPMSFLEEITRHRLLNGSLPTELLPLASELDALVAAYTAWMAFSKPGDLTHLGNRQEGYITLPAGELLSTYRDEAAPS